MSVGSQFFSIEHQAREAGHSLALHAPAGEPVHDMCTAGGTAGSAGGGGWTLQESANGLSKTSSKGFKGKGSKDTSEKHV